MEVGYTSETRYAENLQERMLQHEKLHRALSRVGFEVSNLPVVLGTMGGAFYGNLDNLAIGIPG